MQARLKIFFQPLPDQFQFLISANMNPIIVSAAALCFFFLLFAVIFVFHSLKILLPALFGGVMYVPTSRRKVTGMIELCRVRPGMRAVDLGSGDGRLVIALAAAGAEAHGYEVNPFLMLRARLAIRRAGLRDRAFIHWGSFWSIDLGEFDIITVYGLPFIMSRLSLKLRWELRTGARVVTNKCPLPDWPLVEKGQGIFVFERRAEVSEPRLPLGR